MSKPARGARWQQCDSWAKPKKSGNTDWKSNRKKMNGSITGFGSRGVCLLSGCLWLGADLCPLHCCLETRHVRICPIFASEIQYGRFLRDERRFGKIVEGDLQDFNIVTVPTCENILEGFFYISGVQSWRLNKGESVLFWNEESGSNKNLSVKPLNMTGCLQQWPVPAKTRASSVGTALRWRRSLLFPTSMMTMLLSAWSLSSFSQRSTFSYVRCLAMSYTSRAPTAPR